MPAAPTTPPGGSRDPMHLYAQKAEGMSFPYIFHPPREEGLIQS